MVMIVVLDYIDNQRVDGCFVGYSLQSHPLLDKVLHLMPENVLIGGDDIVPGISESNVNGKTTMQLQRQPFSSIYFHQYHLSSSSSLKKNHKVCTSVPKLSAQENIKLYRLIKHFTVDIFELM